MMELSNQNYHHDRCNYNVQELRNIMQENWSLSLIYRMWLSYMINTLCGLEKHIRLQGRLVPNTRKNSRANIFFHEIGKSSINRYQILK